jgi:hypothetical protein
MSPVRQYLCCPQPEHLRGAEDQDLSVRTHSLTVKPRSTRPPSPFIYVMGNTYYHGQ